MNRNKAKREIKKFLKRKNLYKSIAWRGISVVLSFLTVFLITGSIKIGGTFALLDSVVKIVVYYFHEQRWQKWTTKKIRNIKKKHNERKKEA